MKRDRTGVPVGISLTVLVGLVCLAAAILVWGGEHSPSSLADRVRDVAGQLRCPVCHGESVYDSPAALAGRMRGIIRTRLASGESKAKVADFFVSRYGQWILLSPPSTGVGLIAWLAPIGLLLSGFALIFMAAWGWWRRRSAPDPKNDIVSASDAAIALDGLTQRLETGEITSEAFSEERARIAATIPPATDKPPPSRSPGVALQVVGAVAASVALAAIVSLVFGIESTRMPQAASQSSLQIAVADANQAVRSHPNSVRLRTILATLYLRAGNVKKAAREYRQALNLNGANGTIRLDLGYTLARENRSGQALAALRPMARAGSSNPEFWWLEGLAHRERGQRNLAIRDFQRCLTLTPRGSLARSAKSILKQLNHEAKG